MTIKERIACVIMIVGWFVSLILLLLGLTVGFGDNQWLYPLMRDLGMLSFSSMVVYCLWKHQ